MTHSQTDRQQREESRRFAPSLTPNSPLFPGKSRKRRHLSRLAAPSHGRWRRKQAREAPQINREHRRRKRSLTLARPRNLTCGIVPTYASTWRRPTSVDCVSVTLTQYLVPALQRTRAGPMTYGAPRVQVGQAVVHVGNCRA